MSFFRQKYNFSIRNSKNFALGRRAQPATGPTCHNHHRRDGSSGPRTSTAAVEEKLTFQNFDAKSIKIAFEIMLFHRISYKIQNFRTRVVINNHNTGTPAQGQPMLKKNVTKQSDLKNPKV